MSELAKARRKLLAIRRAERRLLNRLQDIDWEFDVLQPELEQLNELAAEGKVPIFELEQGNADK